MITLGRAHTDVILVVPEAVAKGHSTIFVQTHEIIPVSAVERD